MRSAFVVALVAGCYHPTVATDVPCSAMGLCPEGQTCDFGRAPPTCVASVSDGGPKDATDAPPDAPPECLDASQCAASAPICDATSHTCRGCAADAECAPISGGACTEYNGQCVADADTIYMAATGADTGTCTSAAPCLTFGFALGQLTATRRTVAVADGAYPGTPGSSALVVSDLGGRVVISGTKLDYTGGPVLSAMTNGTTNPTVVTTQSNTDVVLEGISVANGGQDGIRSSGALLLSHVEVENNNGRGLNATPTSSAATHIWSTRVAANGNEGVVVQNGPLELLSSVIVNNSGGGLDFRNGALTMISTIVGGNGAGGNSNYGGVLLQNLGGRAPTLVFDTIANNTAKGTTTVGGLMADNSAAIAISNSIVSGNAPGAQICPSCTATHTLFSGTPPIGGGNMSGAPAFVSATTFDFHITSASAARNGAGGSTANISYDVDSEVRPQGASSDMGADEIP